MYNFDSLDNYISSLIGVVIFGASIRIYKNNQIVFQKNYGFTGADHQYPITFDSVYRLASNTKVVTAVAALIAQEMGLINIDDYIDKYIPEFSSLIVKDENGNRIDKNSYRVTIKQILTHKSGLGTVPHAQKCLESMTLEDKKDLKSAVNFYSKYPLSFKPGSNRSYSGVIAYDIVARIIEIVSDLSYEDFLKKYVFKPLKMEHSTYSYDSVKACDRVYSSIYDDKHNLVQFDDENRTFNNFEKNYMGGGAGLLSSLNDYCNLALMITNKGVFNNKRILSIKSWNALTERIKNVYSDGRVDYWGLSVMHRTKGYDQLPESSFGWSGAFGTHYWSDPKYGITVVYMHNTMISEYGGSGAKTIQEIEKLVKEILYEPK